MQFTSSYDTVRVEYNGQSKLSAIKAVRDVFRIGLKDSKDSVEGIMLMHRYDYDALRLSYISQPYTDGPGFEIVVRADEYDLIR